MKESYIFLGTGHNYSKERSDINNRKVQFRQSSNLISKIGGSEVTRYVQKTANSLICFMPDPIFSLHA